VPLVEFPYKPEVSVPGEAITAPFGEFPYKPLEAI
jgi:hypothetical protein